MGHVKSVLEIVILPCYDWYCYYIGGAVVIILTVLLCLLIYLAVLCEERVRLFLVNWSVKFGNVVSPGFSRRRLYILANI